MKFTKKQLKPTEIELTVEVSPEKMEAYMDKAAQKLSKEVSVKGFRSGKIPRKILEGKFGVGSIFQEAVNIALPETYSEIVVGEEIDALGQPEVNIEKAAHGNPFIYKATVFIIPAIDVPKYDSVKVAKKDVKIEKDELDEAMKKIQESRAKLDVVKRAAKKDDFVEIHFKTYLGKVPVENGESKHHPVVIGEGKFVPGFEDELIGMKKDDKKEFDVKFPKDYHQKNMAGKNVSFKVEMVEVRERELPKLDDDFAKGMGPDFKDLKDLKAKLEENIKHEKEHKEEERVEGEMLDKLSAKTKFELPAILIDEEKKKMLNEFKQMIEGQGGNFDQYLESEGKSEEDVVKGFTEQAEKRVRVGLLLREIAKKEEIEVLEKDIDVEVEMHKAKYQFNPELAQHIESDEYREYLRGILSNRKVIEFLKGIVIKKK